MAEDQTLPKTKIIAQQSENHEQNQELARRVEAQTGISVNTHSFTPTQRELTEQLLTERRRSLVHLQQDEHKIYIAKQVVKALNDPTEKNLRNSLDSLKTTRESVAFRFEEILKMAKEDAIERPHIDPEASFEEKVARKEAERQKTQLAAEEKKFKEMKKLILSRQDLKQANRILETIVLPPLDLKSTESPTAEISTVRTGGKKPSLSTPPSRRREGSLPSLSPPRTPVTPISKRRKTEPDGLGH